MSEFSDFEADGFFKPSSVDPGRASLGADRRPEVAAAVVYLRSRRIEVPEDEAHIDVLALFDAVHEFEHAVVERGGVLLIAGVDAPRSSGKRFMLPARRDDETIGAFAERVSVLARRIDSD